MRRWTALGWATLASAAVACGGGDDLLLPGSADPAAVSLVQGDQQNGPVGQALPQPLVATVTDASGRPVQGATVVFVLNDPAPGASVSPDTAITGADGNAAASVVLGTRPGTQAGTVEALGAPSASTVPAWVPGRVPRTTLAAAFPSAPVIAVSGETDAPGAGSFRTKTTVAPCTGRPLASVTVATSGWGNAWPTGPFCWSPCTRLTAAGSAEPGRRRSSPPPHATAALASVAQPNAVHRLMPSPRSYGFQHTATRSRVSESRAGLDIDPPNESRSQGGGRDP